MVFDPPKSRRRSLRWLIPTVIVVVVVLALSLSGAGSDTREEIEYLAQITEQSEQLALGGDALRDVVSRLSRIDRPELVTVIDGLRADIEAGLELAAIEPPAVELFAVGAIYRAALQQWSEGVAAFGSGVLAAADNPTDSTPTDIIANALVALRNGDQLFEDLIAELDRLDVPDPIQSLRAVALSPAPGEALALSTAYTEVARSESNSIALRPGIAVSSIVAVPDWQLNPDNLVIMPATDSALFSVVVSNVGNVMSSEEVLTLTLTGVSDPVVMTATVSPLQPGAQTTLEFEAISVSAGDLYEISAVISVADIDSSFEDNEIHVTFQVNSE